MGAGDRVGAVARCKHVVGLEDHAVVAAVEDADRAELVDRQAVLVIAVDVNACGWT